MADVLRLAVPPRHARAEKPPSAARRRCPTTRRPDRSATARRSAVPDRRSGSIRAGDAFLTGGAGRRGRSARGVAGAARARTGRRRLAEAAAVALGRGSGGAADRAGRPRPGPARRRAAGRLPADGYVTLAADLGPAERYRRFLAVSRGEVKVAAGTRAAAFAPVADLALVAVFDDGDDLLAEPRAPYPHAREVLMLRSAAPELRTAGRRVRPHRGGRAAAGRRGWAQADRRRSRAAVRAGRRGSRRPATTMRPAPTPPPPARGFPRPPSPPPGRRWRPTRRCWSRCPAAATCRRLPAPAAAGRPGAGTATVRWRSAVPNRLPERAAGAASPRPISTVRLAVPTSCGRRWSGPDAPPRRSAGLSRESS